MIRILRTLFGIYALIVFAITLIIASTFYVIIFLFTNKKRAPFIAHSIVSRPWSRTLFIFFGIRLEVINRELLNESQTYVFVANHRSQLDIPAYALASKHTVRFLAKAELKKIPLMGFIIDKLYVSVDRSDKDARAKSMENMQGSIEEGIPVFICPEGTRNKGREPLLPFRDGAFRLAIQTQVPVAAMVIKNSEKLLSPLRPIELSPGKIQCYWCKPVPTVGMSEEDIPKLKEMVVEQMLAQLALN